MLHWSDRPYPDAARGRGPLGMSVVLLGLAFAVGCADGDATYYDAGVVDPEGAAGQVGSGGADASGGAPDAGSGGTMTGSGGTAGAGGTGGSGGSDHEPPACLASDATFEWPTPAPVAVPANAAWKSTLELPEDSGFLSEPIGSYPEQVRWIKFITLLRDPDKVYFHNAISQPFHYEFATEFIPEFQGLSRTQFDAVTLRNEGRQAVLGAVLLGPTYPEYGVQLVSLDDLHPELIERIMQTVEASFVAPDGERAYYFPSGLSEECIDGKSAELADRGVLVGSADRWFLGDACYSEGWAIGKLVALASAEIDAAYLEGRLTPNDILLITDSAPAELPYVAGILTLEPSTPNAHTAILARSYGVPFAYLRKADAVAAAESLTGKRVVVSTSRPATRTTLADPHDPFNEGCNVRFIDVEDLSNAQLTEIRRLAVPPPLVVSGKQSSGAFSVSAEGLVPADITHVGGKAAHFGLLRAAVPDETPWPAVAFTFDLWDAFMAEPDPSGTGSLRDEIASRLAAHRWPVDFRALDATLDGVRELIEEATFPATLAGSVVDALGDFDPGTRLRFRSSTNVEDSETFTGAGLYDSVTGCLADDLDADDFGPSLCNPAEDEERGVFRALKRVYASFYFSNAYVERLRRGVNEDDVGMGVLVHHSVPDTNELANGVGTFRASGIYESASLVSQIGAVSVTNPDGSSQPEEMSVERQRGGTAYVHNVTHSSLLPLGEHVLEHEADYTRLMTLFSQVSDAYADATGKTTPFVLDFEYKKVEPGVLSLRQVRPLPQPDTTRDVTPFFVARPAKLCAYTSERNDGFATHRLKARVSLSGDSGLLTSEQIAAGIYTSLSVEYVGAGVVTTLEGNPATFPGATHEVEQSGDQVTLTDAWTTPEATFAFSTRFNSKVARNENPVLTPQDFYFALGATWNAPVPFVVDDFGHMPATRTQDFAALWGYCPEDITITPEFPHIEESFVAPDGELSVVTSYWFPPPPRIGGGGYTAPVMKWEKTTIHGLTTTPLVLTGYFSQTYAPMHHNFGADYVFEPRLEPGLPAAARAELEAADVACLVIRYGDEFEREFWVIGLDGSLRRL